MKIKMYLLFLLNMILINPVKTGMLIVTYVTFSYTGSFQDIVTEHNIRKEAKIDGKTVYIAESEDGSLEMFEKGDFHHKKGDALIKKEFNDTNIFMGFFFGISALFVLLPILAKDLRNDEDVSWDPECAWERTLEAFIECEVEGGNHLYFIGDRLVRRSKDWKDSKYLAREVARSTLASYPKQKSKKKNRNDKLDELGI